MNEQLEYLMRPHGFMRRSVTLEKGWYHDAIGAMPGTRSDDGSIVALLPSGLSGYTFMDSATGKRVKLNKSTDALIDDEAICFYKPLPLEKVSVPALIKYIVQTLSTADFVLLGLATLAVTLIGLLGPMLNNIVFGGVVTSGDLRLLLAITIFLVCAAISTALISSVKELLMARITTKMSLSVQAATMMRIMSLPADFFKDYSSGELSTRSGYVNNLCGMLVSTVLSTGLTALFSLIYISQIFTYS